jgi:hypothetical protein
MSKETLVAELPVPVTEEPELQMTPVTEDSESNVWLPTTWKKVLLLAISYGLASRVEETPGPLISLLNKFPNSFVARLAVTVVIYVILLWLIKKFQAFDLD